MPDLSDVGPPAKGPGLPHRVAEAPPPPVRVRIEHGKNVAVANKIHEEIVTNVPGAIVETVVGADDEKKKI